MENNKKTRKEQTSKTKIKGRLKQLIQRSSSLRAEKGKDDEPKQLTLRFSPTAWAKLLYFRDKSNNEVGGFGITEPDDLLYVTDFLTVKQKVSGVSVSFDDEAVASKALQGARELVLEHDVKFINAIGGHCADAVHPFLTDAGVVYVPLVPTDTRPDRPYCVAGGDITPQCNMLNLRLATMVLPTQEELGRPWTYAVTTQDCIMSRMNGAWEVGAAIATGFDIVYEEFFSVEQIDFAPVITAIMATNPDVISLCEAWPTYQTLMWEQLYLQGYEGVVIQNYADWEANLMKIPAEYAAARYGIDSFPLMDDPWWGEPSWQASFTRVWNERYGPGAPEDVKRHMTGIDWDHVVWLMPWCIGAQQWGIDHPGEGFPNNDQILATLRAMDSFPTILGPGHMSGMEMFGIDNMIEQPVPMCMFDLEAKDKRIVAQYNFEPWFQVQKHIMIGAVEEREMMWYQR